MNLAAGRLEGIGNPAEPHPAVVLDHHVAGPRIVVAGLTHRPDVDHRLRGREIDGHLRVAAGHAGRQELRRQGEQTGNVGVALEAVAADEFEDVLHLQGIIDVFGKHVFIERPAGRAVHEHEVAVGMRAGQFAQEIHQRIGRVPRQSVV